MVGVLHAPMVTDKDATLMYYTFSPQGSLLSNPLLRLLICVVPECMGH
jgi:hypothetical protein